MTYSLRGASALRAPLLCLALLFLASAVHGADTISRDYVSDDQAEMTYILPIEAPGSMPHPLRRPDLYHHDVVTAALEVSSQCVLCSCCAFVRL